MLFNHFWKKKNKLLKTMTFLKDIAFFSENGVKMIIWCLKNEKLALVDFKVSNK